MNLDFVPKKSQQIIAHHELHITDPQSGKEEEGSDEADEHSGYMTVTVALVTSQNYGVERNFRNSNCYLKTTIDAPPVIVCRLGSTCTWMYVAHSVYRVVQ